jgi:isopentenyl diphosphate isomerase/L-lactate dehydrogenase-like FMN-dependent dehydrogenase
VEDVGSVHTATDVLGTKMAFPIMIAPPGTQVLLHPDGEMAMHQSASGFL